jgi:hypothetical protein
MMTNQLGMSIQKRYFDLEEIAQALSIEFKDIVHIAAHGDLPVLSLPEVGWLMHSSLMTTAEIGEDHRHGKEQKYRAPSGYIPKICRVTKAIRLS